jgi:predicted RNA-binding protein with RPS1 domain
LTAPINFQTEDKRKPRLAVKFFEHNPQKEERSHKKKKNETEFKHPDLMKTVARWRKIIDADLYSHTPSKGMPVLR